jgi:hypothetical protein
LWNPRLTSVVGQAGIPQFTKKYANPSFLLISKYYPQLELISILHFNQTLRLFQSCPASYSFPPSLPFQARTNMITRS